MKKQFVSIKTRASVSKFAIAFLLLMNQAFANPVFKGEEPFVNIKYVGVVEQRAQFQFDLVNDNEEAYVLTIQEEDGTVLYKEKINQKIFTKKFEWNNEDLNSSKLVFAVTGEKTKKTQTFEVNTSVRTVKDVVITKL